MLIFDRHRNLFAKAAQRSLGDMQRFRRRRNSMIGYAHRILEVAATVSQL
jgi:hypothetical protein